MSFMSTLEGLREALACCAATLVEHRADLIESLGDRMCGSGMGPRPEEVEHLHLLERMHDALRLAYAEGLLRAGQGATPEALQSSTLVSVKIARDAASIR